MIDTLSKALEITKKIEAACEQSEWSTVEKLQFEREILVRKAAQQSLPELETDQQKVREITELIRSIDQTIFQSVEAHQHSLIKERQQANRGKKMSKAYQSSGR